MATKASTLLRAARTASLASRAAAAAASRAAAMASRAARAAGVAADVARAVRPRSDLICPLESSKDYFDLINSANYEHLPDDSKTPTDEDLESDEAVWALYERWCKAFNKKRDHAEMVRRFKIFRYSAEDVHRSNTCVPEDPKQAAIWLKKRKKAKLLLSKGKDVSHFHEWHLPAFLGPLADGGDPFLRKFDYELLKNIENMEACLAPKDVTVE